MINIKKSILLKTLALALSLNVSYAYTTDRSSHLNSGLTNFIGEKTYTANFYGWHSSATAYKDKWIFYYDNEDLSGNIGSYSISNSNITSFFTGSKVFDNTIAIYYKLPEQVEQFIDVYGVENLGMKITVGNVNSTKNNEISYSIVNNLLKIEFNPVFQTTNTTLWQGTKAWNSMNAYGKISIPTVRSGYGKNYLSSTFNNITGSSIVVDSNVLASAVKNASGGMSFDSSQYVSTSLGTTVPLSSVSTASSVWGGGNHGVYFEYPMTIQFYDTTIHSNSISVSQAKFFDGSSYWVKADDNFKATISAYTANDSSVVKVNSQHLRIQEGSDYTYIDARLHSNQNSIAKWSDFSNVNFKNNLSSGSRNGKTLTTNYVISLSGDRDIALRGLSRLVQHSSDFSKESVYREAYSDNEIYIKSDSAGPNVTLSSKPTWIRKSDYAYIQISDSRSGIASTSVKYRINSGNWLTPANNSTVGLINDGIYDVEVVSTDRVGNKTTKTEVYRVDKTAPNIYLSLYPAHYTNGEVDINVNITDGTSGVAVTKWASGYQYESYFENSGNVFNSNSVTVYDNGTYTFYAKDNAGNTSVETITVYNIDRDLPTISGTLDYPWTRWSRTIEVHSIDEVSGMKSLELWNDSRTVFIKSGVLSKYSASLTHTIYEEGITKYKIEAVDVASNVSTANVTVRIDNTAPTASISIPAITNDKKIDVSIGSVLDAHSGAKEIWISENSSFSSGVVVKSTLADINNTSKTKKIPFTLSAKNTMESHFSSRTVYVRVLDNVGNYRDYSYTVKLIPKNPDIPNIITPAEDQLYIDDERVILKWSYNSKDIDIGYLPQQKAEIQLKHVDTGKISNFVVIGEVFEQQLSDLDYGDYEITVKVYNFENVYSQSLLRKFRINKFKLNGNVLSLDIKTSSAMRYVSVLTKSDIPKGTSIEGKVYYDFDSNGIVNKSKYISFSINNQNRLEEIMKLPKKTDKVRVEYFLKGDKSNEFISPILDHTIVYAR